MNRDHALTEDVDLGHEHVEALVGEAGGDDVQAHGDAAVGVGRPRLNGHDSTARRTAAGAPGHCVESVTVGDEGL